MTSFDNFYQTDDNYASTDFYYGSGFTNGNAPPSGPDHLPGHSTFDVAVGKNFGDHFSLGVSAINVANRRVLLITASRLAARII